ncbi:MAG TPA: cytochrome c oxidase subunit II [Burkholderiales bacterium]|nr:cytochrome c oxidase subunit II [Burkholderiales bacterium]
MTIKSRLLPVAGFALALFSGVVCAQQIQPNRHDFQPPVTPVAREIYDLHYLMLAICLVVFFGVLAVMIYSIVKHRKAVGAKAEQFHENTTVEIIWTLVPFLILVGMAWPATKSVLAIKDTSAPDITIKATGYQWKWGYDYIKGEGEGISFLANLSTPYEQIYAGAQRGTDYLLETDRELVVPVNKKVRIITTANDVIHAWWVPALGVKQDAVPGFVRDTWFYAEKEGVYRGQCAELCGKDHAFMPIVVRVVSADAYSDWVAKTRQAQGIQPAGVQVAAAETSAPAAAAPAAPAEDLSKEWNKDELMARGEKVYGTTCAVCHQGNGQGTPPMFPAQAGSDIVNGPKGPHIDLVMNGKPGTAMAAFGPQLSDVDLAAVITYTRNSWGNKPAENVVQPAEIKAARK